MLGVPKTSPTASAERKVARSKVVEIDWNVVIKRSFIEVVIPESQQVMRRSVSDGALPRFEKPEMRWKSNKLDQDMSDVSTNVSLGADDVEPHLVYGDLCWSSDGEGDTEASASPLSWQC